MNKDHFGSHSRDNSIQGLNQLLHQLNSPSNIGNLNTNNILDRNRNTNQLPILPNYDNGLFNQLPSNLNNNLQNSQNQPASSPPSNIQAFLDPQQIFILCLFFPIILFFFLSLVFFIYFKQRKRHFKNKNKATILQLDQLSNEEQQQMLLLMQQTQTQSSLNRTSQPAQILISGNNRGYLQQPIANQPDLVRSDKMQLITRLNQSGTMTDHLLIRNNESQQSNKKVSPLNTMNNNVSNLQMLKQSNTISNSNVSGSLTTTSVNSNPSHNSDEEHQLNTPKYNRNKQLLFIDKPSPIFTNKINSNLNSSFQNTPTKYLVAHQTRQDSSNHAYEFEEPDYAEPMLGSVNKFENFEKFNKECKQSINSHSGSNRSPSDISDNYDQFENEHYEQQFYDKCEQYENNSFSYKTTNGQAQFRDFAETDSLLIGDNQDAYNSCLELQQNGLRKPPLPKTQPPIYTMQNQRFSNFNSPKHLTLNNFSNEAQLISSKKANLFTGSTNQAEDLSNGHPQMGLHKKSYASNTSKVNSNSNSTSSNNKFIQVN